MKLEQIQCKPFARAQGVAVSPSYLIGCTGRRAVVLDRRLQLVHTFDGLDYVYFAAVSPDEKKLLLVSNGSSALYIADLVSGKTQKVTVKAPYNDGLGSQGVWSFDGKSLFVPIRCINERKSVLRQYQADDPRQYEDHLEGEYYLSRIHRLPQRNAYLLIGRRRGEDQEYFIYYDGHARTECPVEGGKAIGVFGSCVDETTGQIMMNIGNRYRVYSPEGKLLRTVAHPEPKDRTLAASSVFAHLLAGKPEAMEQFRALSQSMGMENIPAPDDIQKYLLSRDGRFAYYASQSGFYLTDAGTDEILARIPVQYGVQDVEEVAPDVIALATWSGVKLYRIVEDQV